MTRIRAFDFPHKALRNIISQFTYQAGTVNYQNQHEVEDLQKLGNAMFELLEAHLHHEETGTFSHIESRRSGAVQFELDDHDRIEALQDSLKQKLNEGPIGGHDFYLEACKFQSEYLQHINHEETVTEKILWELFSDEELINQRMEIIKSIPPPQLMTWFKYGIPASTLPDSINMLKGFKAGAPPEAFQAALNVIQPVLDNQRFEALLKGLE